MRKNDCYEIILAKRVNATEEIVLARREDFESNPNSPGVYVTWLATHGGYCWGHYVSDPADAAKDFCLRVERGY